VNERKTCLNCKYLTEPFYCSIGGFHPAFLEDACSSHEFRKNILKKGHIKLRWIKDQ